MNEAPWPSLFGLIAGVTASAFAVAQLALRKHRTMTDRFLQFVETSLGKNEETLSGIREGIAHLNDAVRENTQVVLRVSERFGVAFKEGN